MNNVQDVKNLLTNLGVDVSRQNIDMVILDLGLVVEPEHPEPGTWHTVTDGVYKNRRAYVNGYADLMIFTSHGDYDVILSSDTWPDLQSVSRVELIENQVEKLYEYVTGGYWDNFSNYEKDKIVSTINAALRVYGYAAPQEN